MTSIGPLFRARRQQVRHRWSALVVAVTVTSAAVLLATAGTAQAIATPVPLGTADAFAVLAGTGITNTGPTTITGDVGTDPTPSITGQADITLIPPSAYHPADAVSTLAKSDLVTGYDNAAGQTRTADSGSELGGQTFVAGVYGTDSALGLTGTVTLDGQGSTDGIWVFQAGSTLITASSSTVALINGAQACNVYWQVGSSATLGTSTSFAGTILALTSISATTGATIQGRLLARNGAVTLDTNTITRAPCELAPPTTTVTTTTTVTGPTTTVTGPTTTVTGPTTTVTGPTTTVTGPTTTTVLGPTTTETGPTTTDRAGSDDVTELGPTTTTELGPTTTTELSPTTTTELSPTTTTELSPTTTTELSPTTTTELSPTTTTVPGPTVTVPGPTVTVPGPSTAASGYGQVKQVPVGSVDTGDGSLFHPAAVR